MIINQLFDTPLNEVSLGDYAKKAMMSRALAQMDKAFYPDKAGSDETIRRRTQGIDRAKQRSQAAAAKRPGPAPLTGEQREKLQAKLRDLEREFDPSYEYSDDYSVWSRNRDLSRQIQSIRSQLSKLDEQEQIDELSWKGIQRGAKKFAKGANKFTKNVADTGAAVGQAASALGGAVKQVGKTTIADPVRATYNATKSGLGKAADVAKGVYGDVKKGTQAVGQAVDTVGTDVGQGLKKVGRGVGNVVGGTAGALGSVAGGATTGAGRAAAKGFNAGVKNVGGAAVDRLQTNVFKIKQKIELKQAEIAELEKELGQAQQTATEPAAADTKVSTFAPLTDPATGRRLTQAELRAKYSAQPEPAAEPATAAAPEPAAAPAAAPVPKPTVSAPAMPGYGQVTYKMPTWTGRAPAGAAKATAPVPKQKWTGRAPTGAEAAAYQKAINAPQLPESLSWSKDWDPSRLLIKKIR